MTLRWKQECQKEADAFLRSITALGSTPHKELLRAPAKMKSAFPISTSNSGGCIWLDSATGTPTVNRAGHWGRAPCHQGKSEAAFHSGSHCNWSYKALVWLPQKSKHELHRWTSLNTSSQMKDFTIPVNYSPYSFSSFFFPGLIPLQKVLAYCKAIGILLVWMWDARNVGNNEIGILMVTVIMDEWVSRWMDGWMDGIGRSMDTQVGWWQRWR